MSGEERLQKIIARAGLASRRGAETMITEGRVTVDGAVVKTLGAKCDPALHDVRVDGVRVKADRVRRYVVIHKPRGYLTTRRDPGRRPTVMELLPPPLRTLFPVGRLDMTTSGLLLLSDDGEFALRMTHPRFGVEKRYLATVRGVPSEGTLERLRRGLRVDGEWMRVRGVELLGQKAAEAVLGLTLREGKYREVRRMLEAVGHPVLKLHRERIGSLTDKGLPAGAFRHLTSREVERLLTATRGES